MRIWFFIAAILVATPTVAFDLGRSQEWEERMLEAVNAERAERGLRPYRLDRNLEEAAADHSRRMAEAGRLTHQLAREPDLRTRIAATGLRFDSAGENVAYSTRIDQIHDNLMHSRGHRENLLADKYDSIGIAIYESGGRYWVTQDFARVTSLATAPQAANEFAAAVAELRRSRRLEAATVETSTELRSAACEMARGDDVDASLVPSQPGRRHVVVFTTFEPGELSGAARRVAGDPEVDEIAVGVCHRSSRRYPAGVFWFALAY